MRLGSADLLLGRNFMRHHRIMISYSQRVLFIGPDVPG